MKSNLFALALRPRVAVEASRTPLCIGSIGRTRGYLQLAKAAALLSIDRVVIGLFFVSHRGPMDERHARDRRDVGARRATTTLALVAVAAGGLVLAATSLPIGSGVALDLLGVAAAVGVLAVVAALARPNT